jgi:hypothetical protein
MGGAFIEATTLHSEHYLTCIACVRLLHRSEETIGGLWNGIRPVHIYPLLLLPLL